MQRQRGANGSLAMLACAVVVAGGMAAISADTAVGATTCRVRNVTQDTSGRSLIRMVRGAVDGDRLRVGGTCPGETLIDVDILIAGRGEKPTLTGRGQTRVLSVTPGATATVTGLRIQHGRLRWSHGAGVRNQGSLTLVDTTVRLNRTKNGHGGGIRNLGTLVVRGSTITGNRGGVGGGVSNHGPSSSGSRPSRAIGGAPKAAGSTTTETPPSSDRPSQATLRPTPGAASRAPA